MTSQANQRIMKEIVMTGIRKYALIALFSIGGVTSCSSSDDDGNDSDNLQNQPPTVQILLPADGHVEVSADVLLEGLATDQEDGVLTGDSIVWTTDRVDLQDETLGTGSEIMANLSRNVCEGDTNHVITMRATDSNGATGEAFIQVGARLVC